MIGLALYNARRDAAGKQAVAHGVVPSPKPWRRDRDTWATEGRIGNTKTTIEVKFARQSDEVLKVTVTPMN